MAPKRVASKKPIVHEISDSDNSASDGSASSEYKQEASDSDDDDQSDGVEEEEEEEEDDDDDDFAARPKQPKHAPASSSAGSSASSKKAQAPPSKKAKLSAAASSAASKPASAPAKKAAASASELPELAKPPSKPAAKPAPAQPAPKSASPAAPPKPAAAPAAKAKPAAAPAPAPSGTGDSVLDYINALCAPVNAQMVSDYFKGSLPKAAAEKKLFALASAGKVRHKEFNKAAKVFWTDQRGMPPLTPAESKTLDAEIAQARSERGVHAATAQRLQAALRGKGAQKTTEALQEEQKAAAEKAEQAEAALEAARKQYGGDADAPPLSAAEEAQVREQIFNRRVTTAHRATTSLIWQVRKEYIKMRKLYLDRRRTCMEMVGNMGEAAGKTDKKMMETLGLETDEEYGGGRAAIRRG